MAVTNYALGRLKPLLYFESRNGTIALPLDDESALAMRDRARERGYELKEADTLYRVIEVEKRLREQEYRENQDALEHDKRVYGALRKRTRERILARMTDPDTPAYDRQFLEYWLMLRDEKREKHAREFMLHNSCLTALNFDHPKEHLQAIADRVPDMKDTTCKRCGKFRKFGKSDLCGRCLSGLEST